MAKEVEYDPNNLETQQTISNLLQEQARQLGAAKKAIKKALMVSDVDIAKVILKEGLREMQINEGDL